MRAVLESRIHGPVSTLAGLWGLRPCISDSSTLKMKRAVDYIQALLAFKILVKLSPTPRCNEALEVPNQIMSLFAVLEMESGVPKLFPCMSW